jgi:hypothetical protein
MTGEMTVATVYSRFDAFPMRPASPSSPLAQTALPQTAAEGVSMEIRRDEERPFPENSRVVFAANTSWYLYNHYRDTIAAFLRAGCEVYAITPNDAYAGKLAALGCRQVSIPLVPASKNPFREARAVAAYLGIYRNIRPHVAFHFTIKCNLYGALAAGYLGIPHVNNISGLGSAFRNERLLNRFAQAAYRFTQRRTAWVFFQNLSDFEYMRDRGLASEAQSLGACARSGPAPPAACMASWMRATPAT